MCWKSVPQVRARRASKGGFDGITLPCRMAGCFGNCVPLRMPTVSKTARVSHCAGCFGNKGRPEGLLFSKTARVSQSAGCFGNIRPQTTRRFSKTARAVRRPTRRQTSLPLSCILQGCFRRLGRRYLNGLHWYIISEIAGRHEVHARLFPRPHSRAA